MAKESKTVNLRLPIEQVEWLTRESDSINQAVVNAIERLQMIEKYADRDIAHKFSKEEWCFLADSLNGSITEGDYRYRNSTLVAHNNDSVEYDGLNKKWGVDVAQLNSKIMFLSSSSIEAIYRRIEAFWANQPADMETWAVY